MQNHKNWSKYQFLSKFCITRPYKLVTRLG